MKLPPVDLDMLDVGETFACDVAAVDAFDGDAPDAGLLGNL
jgi:hypothetical protein